MPRSAWGLFACLWLATLTVFLRDPAWELVTEATVFLLAAVVLPSHPCRRHPPGLGLVAGLTAVAALGGLQLALDATLSPSATALMTVRWLALAAWCYTAQLVLPVVRARFLELLVQSAGALALLSLLMWATSAGRVYWLWPSGASDVLGPWTNPNHFAVWCELLLAPAVWLAAQNRRFLWAVGALLAGGAASGSRAGLALISLELILLLGCLAWRRRLNPGRLALTFLAFPLLAGLLGGEALWNKLRDPEPLLYRDQIWGSSLTLWRGRPWIGHGLGTFVLAYPEAAAFDTGELVDHAHNDWLEWGVEGGLILTGLMLAGYLGACRRVFDTPWLLGVPLAGLHALVDYPMARFPLALWVILLLALAGLERPRFMLKQSSVGGRTKLAPPPP